MSNWYQADEDDLSVDWDREELDILVSSDRFGNNYVSVKLRDLTMLAGLPEYFKYNS